MKGSLGRIHGVILTAVLSALLSGDVAADLRSPLSFSEMLEKSDNVIIGIVDATSLAGKRDPKVMKGHDDYVAQVLPLLNLKGHLPTLAEFKTKGEKSLLPSVEIEYAEPNLLLTCNVPTPMFAVKLRSCYLLFLKKKREASYVLTQPRTGIVPVAPPEALEISGKRGATAPETRRISKETKRKEGQTEKLGEWGDGGRNPKPEGWGEFVSAIVPVLEKALRELSLSWPDHKCLYKVLLGSDLPAHQKAKLSAAHETYQKRLMKVLTTKTEPKGK